jgi:hypothetical protein
MEANDRCSLGGAFPFGGARDFPHPLLELFDQLFAEASRSKNERQLFDIRGRKLPRDIKGGDVPFPGVVLVLDFPDQYDAQSFVPPVLAATAKSNEHFQRFLINASNKDDWPSFPLVYPLASELPPSLCGTFQRQATWTWKCLEQTRGFGGHLGEETLTDLNLLEIRSRHRTEIITKTFTKAKESTEGADWEWWLTGVSGQWLGFRIQAKVIDVRTNRYEQLHYIGPSGVAQARLLCDRALDSSPRCIPLYCLYSHYSGDLNDLPKSSRFRDHQLETFGCAFVDAFFIRSNKSCHTFEHLFPLMVPWHTLVCADTDSSADLPRRAWDIWAGQIRRSDENSPEHFGVVEAPPPYVARLLHNELNEHPDSTVRRLTVFRESERAD